MIRWRAQTGLTLVEVLVTIVLLSVLLVPAIQALRTGVTGTGIHADVAAAHYRVTSRLEELLAEPFSELVDAAMAAGAPTVLSSYSDAAGPPGRMLVYLSLYDGDNADADGNPFTGVDPDLLWIRVDIEGSVHTLQTIRASGY
ncbi:MAG: prepilin-type N-terminal cleavage/methylation domain-containing protein [Gammaproteobacteria bacterium]|nr:prepilin-type N-terminal cleavage/methylation domain-containing protein [Gammaproteobacteria bacterium]